MFLKIVDFLARLCPPPAVHAGDAEMPGWMRNLHTKIADVTTKTNVRLFIARIVNNRADAFKPYAREWLRYSTCLLYYILLALFHACTHERPLMQCVLLFEGDRESFNSFVTDLCVVLLSWHKLCIPEPADARLAVRTVAFLMRNSRHESFPILTNNIGIVHLFLLHWRFYLNCSPSIACNLPIVMLTARPILKGHVPAFPVYALFSNTDRDSKINAPGIHLLSAVSISLDYIIDWIIRILNLFLAPWLLSRTVPGL
jgi:hypothetical protein